MKKLGKLTLNEMQGYAQVHAEEQMTMKGGVSLYHWAHAVYTAWKISKDIMDMVKGSSGSSTPSCPPGSISIHQADSVVFDNGVKAYGSGLICIPNK